MHKVASLRFSEIIKNPNKTATVSLMYHPSYICGSCLKAIIYSAKMCLIFVFFIFQRRGKKAEKRGPKDDCTSDVWQSTSFRAGNCALVHEQS